VNGDGVVGIMDITAMVDYLLSGNGPINRRNADLVTDGNVDIADLTGLVDLLLTE